MMFYLHERLWARIRWSLAQLDTTKFHDQAMVSTHDEHERTPKAQRP